MKDLHGLEHIGIDGIRGNNLISLMHFIISNGVLFNICKLKKGEEYGYKNIKNND